MAQWHFFFALYVYWWKFSETSNWHNFEARKKHQFVPLAQFRSQPQSFKIELQSLYFCCFASSKLIPWVYLESQIEFFSSISTGATKDLRSIRSFVLSWFILPIREFHSSIWKKNSFLGLHSRNLVVGLQRLRFWRRWFLRVDLTYYSIFFRRKLSFTFLSFHFNQKRNQ